MIFFTPEQLETMHEQELNDSQTHARRDLQRGEGCRRCVVALRRMPRSPSRRGRGSLLFFVAPVAMVVWFSFGYKPGVFGTPRERHPLVRPLRRGHLARRSSRRSRTRCGSAIIGTVLCFLIGAPVAYWMAFKVQPVAPRHPHRPRPGAVLDQLPGPHDRLAGDPRPRGLAVERCCRAIGVLDGPLDILYTRTAVHHRRRLQLPAADDPAAVRRASTGSARHCARRRRTSAPASSDDVLPRDAAARRSRASSPACCWSSSR